MNIFILYSLQDYESPPFGECGEAVYYLTYNICLSLLILYI